MALRLRPFMEHDTHTYICIYRERERERSLTLLGNWDGLLGYHGSKQLDTGSGVEVEKNVLQAPLRSPHVLRSRLDSNDYLRVDSGQ